MSLLSVVQYDIYYGQALTKPKCPNFFVFILFIFMKQMILPFLKVILILFCYNNPAFANSSRSAGSLG